MKQYEYKRMTLSNPVENRLSRLGFEGWQLVSELKMQGMNHHAGMFMRETDAAAMAIDTVGMAKTLKVGDTIVFAAGARVHLSTRKCVKDIIDEVEKGNECFLVA